MYLNPPTTGYNKVDKNMINWVYCFLVRENSEIYVSILMTHRKTNSVKYILFERSQQPINDDLWTAIQFYEDYIVYNVCDFCEAKCVKKENPWSSEIYVLCPNQ